MTSGIPPELDHSTFRLAVEQFDQAPGQLLDLFAAAGGEVRVVGQNGDYVGHEPPWGVTDQPGDISGAPPVPYIRLFFGPDEVFPVVAGIGLHIFLAGLDESALLPRGLAG